MYNSFGLLFFWRVFLLFFSVDWNSGFEKTSLWKKGWLQKTWQKKTTAGLIVRKPQKRLCKPWGKNGEDFLGLVIVPAELPVINLQAKTDRYLFVQLECLFIANEQLKVLNRYDVLNGRDFSMK